MRDRVVQLCMVLAGLAVFAFFLGGTLFNWLAFTYLLVALLVAYAAVWVLVGVLRKRRG